MSNDPFAIYRFVVIDGSENGPDLNGGRTVCIDGTGDRPLSEYTIDPTGAACSFQQMTGVPVAPTTPVVSLPPPLDPVVSVSPVPEPEVSLLLACGLAVVAWRARGRQVQGPNVQRLAKVKPS